MKSNVKLQGEIEPCVLAGLLQFLADRSPNAGYLEVTAPMRQPGKIWIKEGRLHAAEFEALRAKEAVRELLRLSKGKFAFIETEKVPEKEISEDTIALLMACMQEIDESGGVADDGESAAVAVLKPTSESAALASSIPIIRLRQSTPKSEPVAAKDWETVESKAQPAAPAPSVGAVAPAAAPPAAARTPPEAKPAATAAVAASSKLHFNTGGKTYNEPVQEITPEKREKREKPQRTKKRRRFSNVTVAAAILMMGILAAGSLLYGDAWRTAWNQVADKIANPIEMEDIQVNPGDPPPSEVTLATDEKGWPPLQISGILASTGTTASAFVNGNLIQAGDMVEGALVIEIRSNGVVFKYIEEDRFFPLVVQNQ